MSRTRSLDAIAPPIYGISLKNGKSGPEDSDDVASHTMQENRTEFADRGAI